MKVWPIVAWALIALVAYDFIFGKEMKRRWILTVAFWALFSTLLLSTPPSCTRSGDDVEGPDIPYPF